jgi:hypothetical protein
VYADPFSIAIKQVFAAALNPSKCRCAWPRREDRAARLDAEKATTKIHATSTS